MPSYTQEERERGYRFSSESFGSHANYRIVKDLMPQTVTVQKSTVKLWIKGEERFWNPENKVEYP